MTRNDLIERILRAVYGEQPTDDSNITKSLVNNWIQDGIAAAAKLNYRDNDQMTGIAFVNNSFYTTFKNITFSQDELFTWICTLPQIPIGIGRSEGITSFRIVDSKGVVSQDGVPLSESQWTYFRQLPQIPNRFYYKQENDNVYVFTLLQLDVGFSGTAVMVSAGDPNDLTAVLNVPPDYISIISDYCIEKLRQSRLVPKDISNDGADNS